MNGLNPIFDKKNFNVADFGAISSDSLQTEAIQNALDSCFLSGGGTVKIPAGIYRTGGLRLRSNTCLYLESGAILKASNDPKDYFSFKTDKIEPIQEYDSEQRCSVYPYSRWNNAVIRVINAKNIAIIGEKGSYIDGGNCYDPEGEEGYRGPHAINVQNSEDLYLKGYTITDSANWAHAIFNTQNIYAANLTVFGGHDGFDVRTCDNVLIENSEFYTGDDCIAGFDNNDVVITNCILNTSCSALRFGGNNILVEGCKAFAPGRYGHRYTLTKEEQKLGLPTNEHCRHSMYNAFLYYCDHRAVIRKTPGDIIIKNCEFVDPDSLFSLSFSEEHVWCCNRSLSSIRFENCTVKGVTRPIYASGDEREPLSLTLENVDISPRSGYEGINFIESKHCDIIKLSNTSLKGFNDPQILTCTHTEIINLNSTHVEIKKVPELEEYDC